MNKMRYALLLVLCLSDCLSFSQSVFYQENCNCGITGAGYSNGSGGGGITNATLSLNILPTSTIKKAYLICNGSGEVDSLKINLNGNIFQFDSTTQVGQEYISNSITHVQSSAVHAIEVTSSIYPWQNTYTLIFEEEFPIIGPGFGTFGSFYLLIIYESSSLPNTGVSIILNDKHSIENVNYEINDLLPLDNSNPVGLAIHSDILWDTIDDGSLVYVNGNYIGLIGGSDMSSGSFAGAGVKGHFYYENNQLYGLDDDTPDNVMVGTDGLADIKDYLAFGDTSFDLNLVKQPTAPYNIYIAFYLTYTTACDTFSVSLLTDDTTICKGDSLQFFASGADSYAWSPSEGLSCADCPNPKISPENTTTYFLTSTKYGNCKKVQPIKIRVVDKPIINSFNLIADTCGENSGAITNINANGIAPLIFSLNGNSSSSFSNLQSGWYNVSVTDNNGCSVDSLIFIENIVAAEANFSANPQLGFAPLEVFFTNESRFTNNYIWYVNGDTLTSENPAFIFDSIGTYSVTLIAYNNHFWCADTANATIYVYPPISIFIPNIITANGDNVNDNFTIQVEGGEYIWWHIYNRWGGLVYENEKHITTENASYDLWDGVDFNFNQPVSDGVYFYRILVKSPVGTTEIYTGSLTVVR